MLHEIEIRPDEIADEWAIRSEFWNSEIGNSKPKRRKRERNASPLILCGHGVSLRIENGALAIRDGFTHFPQKQSSYRFYRGDLDLPPRILLLDGSGTLSFDVLSWLAEQGVVLARIKWTGEIAVAGGGHGYAADPAKVEWQRSTRADNAKRLAFASDLIRRKVEASIVTLETHFAEGSARETAIVKARDGLAQLASGPVASMGTIHKIEGGCASAYFSAWREIELRWTGLSHRPIPDAWREFTQRSSVLTGHKPGNWKASHPLNAMLNYAYAVKAAQLQVQTIAEGYDPAFGVMHNADRSYCAFAYDLIEPERPKVDAIILEFVAKRSFAAADFIIRKDGVCRLSPQLARAVAAAVS
jgi:CRISPR-associated endonuclease Cas1